MIPAPFPKSRFAYWVKQHLPVTSVITFGCAVLAASAIAGIWLEVHARVAEDERQAIESVVINSRNVATIAAANLDEVLARTTLYAKAGASLLDGDRTAVPNLNPLSLGDSAYLRTAVFDGHGNLVHSSSNLSTEPDLAKVADLAWKTGEPNAIMIGRSQSDAVKSWRIPVAIPIYQHREPVGAFAAFIDLGYFLNLYKDVDLGPGGRIEIVDGTGSPVVELADATLSTSGGKPNAVVVLHRKAQADRRVDANCTGGTARCVGYQKALARFPLSVVVVRDQASILCETHAQNLAQYWRAGFASALILLIATGAVVFVRRQQHLHGELRWAQAQKQDLIEQLQEEKNRAFQLASADYLTGIPNRMKFLELARAELARAKRSRNTYVLFFLDLDKFKPVNDTLGHAVGDLLLKAVAARLRQSVREYDLIGRFGGDEFVVLVSELPSEDQVAAIADKLVKAICTPFLNLAGHDIEVSTSIGIALYRRDGRDIETLLAHADAAMYSAKSAGRGTYRFYDTALNASSARDFELVSRFRRAISEGEFCLHYQAQVRLEDFRLTGLEALVRWQHPEHGLIHPGGFIPLAETHDLIVPLGDWAIDAACGQIAQWRAAGLPLVPVAVNISAKQLSGSGLSTNILSALERHGVSPDLLEIEITESCLLHDAEHARDILERLHRHGIKISLDDYGTGFSSLSHLKQLPVGAIKIDRSFVRDIRNDTSDRMIVSSTIALAHNLGLHVVAEGVESKEQLVYLKTAGCDEVQGFYFHRPAPPEKLTPILERGYLIPN